MAQTFPFTFGKYEIKSELGHGGFGTVYLARDTKLDRRLAIKIMAPELLRDTAWVSRFQQEARVMARLDHPNIVPIYDISEEDGRLFLAMKLIDGSDLASLIQREGRLPLEQATAIIYQIASALDYAFNLGVVHRDLKPANILLSNSKVALTDFGFAQLVQDNSQSMSLSGGIVGTPAYIAPEVWEEKAQGQASDIYALGCILYEMLTGEVLFQGESTPAIMLAHFKPAPLPDQLPGDTPEKVLHVVRKALAVEPDQRFRSAIEMVEALEKTEVNQPADLYPALLQAMSDKHWQDALQLADSILEDDPNNEEVVEIKDEAQRRVWSLEWQKQAVELFEAGDYATARITVSRWQEIVADDPAAAELSIRIRHAEEAGRLKDSIEQAIAAGDWLGAEALLASWRALAPQDPQLQKLTEQVESEKEAQTVIEAQEVAQLKQSANDALDSQEWNIAEVSIGQLLTFDADDPEIETLNQRLQQGKQEQEKAEGIAFWRNQAEEAMATQQWQSAEKMVARWLQLAPDDPAAKRSAATIATALTQQQMARTPSKPTVEAASEKRSWAPIVLGAAVFGCLGLLGVLVVVYIVSQIPPDNGTRDAAGIEVVDTPTATEVVLPTPTPIPEFQKEEPTPELEISSLQSGAGALNFGDVSNIPQQVRDETSVTLGMAASAEQLALRFLNPNWIDLMYSGNARNLVLNELQSLIEQRRYAISTINYQQSRIQDIRILSNNVREVDACEYWHTAIYDSNNNLVSNDPSFRPVPQTLTLEFLNTPTGPRWLVTDVNFDAPITFCQ